MLNFQVYPLVHGVFCRAMITGGEGRGGGVGQWGCVALAAHANESEGKVRANDES